MSAKPTRLIMGPFNRVEGDLEVSLDISAGAVQSARVTAPLYRGFEQILAGRPPEDALVIAPRICGICSVSQSVAAARALAQIAGTQMPDNGRLVTDLVLAAENAADHLTHFVLFFMPDFARPVYADRPWFEAAQRRFAAQGGQAGQSLVPARARFLHLMGLLAGKWPHSLALQPGGVTKGVDTSERIRLLGILADFRAALETTLFADRLEHIASLDSAESLSAWTDAAPMEQGDFRLFLHIARDLELGRLGLGPTRFISYGSFGLWPAGIVINGNKAAFDPTLVSEDLSHAWMDAPTRPDADKPGAYSWCKAPRLKGASMETGALARHLVAGDPLAWSLAPAGGTVAARVVLRLVELARLVLAMEGWVRDLRPGQPFCIESPLPLRGSGLGLVEAARGALSHRLGCDGGIIRDYAIIAPTTWNFSPRDQDGNPGPLEQALVGAQVRDGEASPVMVQHIVRSFDPCMVCTVH